MLGACWSQSLRHGVKEEVQLQLAEEDQSSFMEIIVKEEDQPQLTEKSYFW